MAITSMGSFTFDYTIQPDDQNSVYSATQVKEKFNSRGDELRTFLNGLVDIFNSTADGSSGADNIAMTPISGITAAANTTQAIAEALKTYADSLSMGAISDNAVSTAKIQDGAVTAAKVAADVATQAELDAEASTRSSADGVLQGNINSEASTRSSADSTLQDNINNLSGAGRTTETVKGNADALGIHLADIVTVAAANKILKLNAQAKLPASITGDSVTVGGKTPGANNGIATLDAGGDVPLSQLGNVPQGTQVITGTYTGDGNVDRTITIGSTPKLIIVTPTSTTTNSKGGIGITGNPYSLTFASSSAGLSNNNGQRPEIVTNGFRVSYVGSGVASLNYEATGYTYLALV